MVVCGFRALWLSVSFVLLSVFNISGSSSIYSYYTFYERASDKIDFTTFPHVVAAGLVSTAAIGANNSQTSGMEQLGRNISRTYTSIYGCEELKYIFNNHSKIKIRSNVYGTSRRLR